MSNRIVKLPSVESFGRLTPDKWLLLKTLEESAEMVEAGKQSYECGGNDEYFEEECEDCEREFYVTRIIDISYDTKPKEATEE